MRLREAAASALHLLVVLSYFALGALAILLVRRPDWHQEALQLLAERQGLFYWIGAGFGVLGFLFLFGFSGVGRGRYLRVALRSGPAGVDSKLIRAAIEECFKKNYPAQIRGAHVSVSKGKSLEVAVEMGSLSEQSQLELLADAESKLLELLQNRFGYPGPLTLFVRSR